MPNTLSSRDKKLIWHPFTQEKTAPLPIAISKAKGSYIYDENGKAYLDLISSWWVNLHGHAHPFIADRIHKQALELEHVIFAGFTHKPAVELCEALSALLPKSLAKFFFSDNGSTSVEVALKMAYQYWRNKGENQKSMFLSFDGGYHGDTFGAMAVGSKSGFHDSFQELFFKVLSIPYPDTWEDDTNVDAKEHLAFAILEQRLEEHGDNIAAIILEPLMQGASGMRMCRATFLQKVIAMVRQKGILVIFDEVMTGFGRTGTNFALEQISSSQNLTPDFLCLSKGITGGFLPLALTVTTEEIYNAFLHNDWKYAFAHGHSYTANPLACAAALASLELLLQDTTREAIANINKAHLAGIELLKKQSTELHSFRVLGTISAFKLGVNNAIDIKIKENFFKSGLMIRPLGNTIYLLPPYSTKPSELEKAYETIEYTISTFKQDN